ncbi:hypothetical protein [Streptomyces filamentosus]|uniref:hypothetical protein n=1 Tax=Streptomyces filamentosus TaxID=67294 RepID=UPI0033F182F5
MGSEYFTAYGDGADAERAFNDVTSAARYEYGHGGYTGTIAEKHAFEIVTRTPMTESDAENYAAELLEGDHPLNDKWGPAGAIPVLTDCRRVEVSIPERDPGFEGFESLEEAARAALAESGLLKEGEKPSYGITGAYEVHPRTGRPIRGTLDVPLKGGPLEHRCWLFFGYASC